MAVADFQSGLKVAERGYRPWRPTHKVRPILGQIEEVLDTYREYLPLTIRQIYYSLIGNHGYPKAEQHYNRLTYYIGRARRAQMISMDVIRDDGIMSIFHDSYSGVEDFHDETGRRARAFRRDRQEGQAVRLEVWCEAAGMLAQIDRVARDYSVEVRSGSGFDSITAKYDVTARARQSDVPIVLLHLGDFDPYGEYLFAAMAEDAAAFLEADRILACQQIRSVRVALTADQVAELSLDTQPTKPSKTKAQETIRDRWIATYGDRTCQLEALPPDQLARAVRDSIEAHLDLDLYRRQLGRERADRAELLALPAGEIDQ